MSRNRDGVRLTRSEKVHAWIGTYSPHGNVVAQRETIRPVTPRELGKDGGIDVRVSNDVRSDGAPQVVGAEQKGLDGALGKAMKEGEEEESDGDPVQGYPQVLVNGDAGMEVVNAGRGEFGGGTHSRRTLG